MKYIKSIKAKVAFVLMKMLIPLIIFIICYNFFTLNEAHEKVAQSNEETLKSYCSNIENTLQTLTVRMTNFISKSINFKLLSKKSTDITAHVQSYEILQDYSSLMDMYPPLNCCYIFSYPNDIFRAVYSDSISLGLKDELLLYFKDLTKDKEQIQELVWQPVTFNSRYFLYLIRGYGNTYSIYVLDLESLYFTQNNELNGKNISRELIFYQENLMLTNSTLLDDNDIILRGEEKYYFSGSPKSYMIIEQAIEYSAIRAAYLAEYKGLLGNLSYTQLLVFIISILSALLIPYGYQQLKKVFFIPMDMLVETMNEIKDGKIDARVDASYTEIEFMEVIQTFNSMIEQINDLKIDTYEKELHSRKTQLEYYQIQIKPHFYINCLKSMYGMLEDGKYEDSKKTIIYLSNHLRYMLKNVSMIVPIETEIEYVKNYLALWQLSLAYPPVMEVVIDPELASLLIPAISILSFVENTIKHTINADNYVYIAIQVSSMDTKDGHYANIHISDNGKGFTEEQIAHLNHYTGNPQTEQSIGIYNVIQRYLLYFGDENVWFAFSNQNGAGIDIFIKMKEDKES